MIYLVVLLTATSVTLLVIGLASIGPAEARVVRRRLDQVRRGAVSYRELQEKRRRIAKREQVEAVLEALGEKVAGEKSKDRTLRAWLVHAGYRNPKAAGIYIALRVILAAGLGIGAFVLLSFPSLSAGQHWILTGAAALLGWMLPFLYVNHRVTERQREISRALPDTLDLCVVCVEAGLGLNQALVRVAEEIDRVSQAMAQELTVVNLQIRAGTPREEALRNLAERTGVDDLRAFTSMLIQADRFGTSIAHALRVHADTLRTARMQRAEEAAAKTTVKMLFPLIAFVFPAIFVILLGPAFFVLSDLFGGLG